MTLERHPSQNDTRRVFTVSELVGMCRELLEEAFPLVWVRGEVSNFRVPSSGHWYFDLKDEGAVLPVAMFRSANVAVPFTVEEGMEVVAGGRLSIYPRQGRFQLIGELLEPVGWGSLQLAFEQLKARLQGEGLFDAGRKRPLPLLPRCVGVVTSPTGAAWRDMCRVWRRRQVPLRAILAPARVQGEGAGEQIASAIRSLNRHGRAEVLIVGRGGGSREDLWAFNEEVVVRAIAESAVPVIAAVGHEVDVTLADLAADRRAATPTAAAEIVAAARIELLDRLDRDRHRLRSALRQLLNARRAALLQLDPRLDRRLRRPRQVLELFHQRLDEAWRGLQAGLDRGLQERRERLGLAVARIEALSPLAVLARGYAICRRQRDGAVVRDPSQVAVGEAVRVLLQRGELGCTVQERDATEVPIVRG